ncbi:hypothetical protein C1645_732438 [Glomus cerebriforme]|uniref:DUF159-domain-containing protein n=1 Tax=Glomus cerebriforme TaxID=658196 RepID=A0A397TKN5_9GLOM|nr:hypothetical protein C1645_732438 [Glomus cerebriforme]
MCGRYVKPETLLQTLEKSNLKFTKWIDKEKYQSSYNVAPCHFQPVARVDYDSHETILHTMRWGLIPSWTKTNPEFSKLIINCRDDSLSNGKSLFNSMKNRKRCIIIADGFYEWLKKGKQRIPYFIKRKDGNLFLFAGLYDCVNFEDEETPLYTYTIITTSASTSIEFLHDRMPAILENGSEELSTWLDPRTPWCPELAGLLKPFTGELEFYPISDDVGKVSNNSPDLITPLDLKRSKNSIANYFKKGQEIEDDENDMSIVPAKHSRTSDDEPISDMKTKLQKSDLDIPSSSKTSVKKVTRSPKKSLKSTPKKQATKKKKVDNVKKSEKITKYFTNSP